MYWNGREFPHVKLSLDPVQNQSLGEDYRADKEAGRSSTDLYSLQSSIDLPQSDGKLKRHAHDNTRRAENWLTSLFFIVLLDT